MIKNVSSLGKRIIAAREAVNINQQALADLLHVHFSHVSKWERDVNIPGLVSILLIAEITKADLVWLLTGKVQERVSLNPNTRALIDAYIRADENKKRIVRLTLEIDDPKGDKHNLSFALIRKKKPKEHEKTHKK